MNSIHMRELTSEEIGLIAHERIFIQPTASIEQHGPHLPVGTDSLIAEAFVKELMNEFGRTGYPALFLPLLPYGKSNEHHDFPGTVYLRLETFIHVLKDIAVSCANSGCEKFVFLNTHGGNHEVLDLLAREIRIETGMRVFVVHPLLKISPRKPQEHGIDLDPLEARLGIHAGQIETSILLHTNGDLVKKDKYESDYTADFSGYKYIDYSETVPFGWITRDVSRNGVIGDPSKASKEEGEKWIRSVTKMLLEVFDEIRRY